MYGYLMYYFNRHTLFQQSDITHEQLNRDGQERKENNTSLLPPPSLSLWKLKHTCLEYVYSIIFQTTVVDARQLYLLVSREYTSTMTWSDFDKMCFEIRLTSGPNETEFHFDCHSRVTGRFVLLQLMGIDTVITASVDVCNIKTYVKPGKYVCMY